MLDRRDFLIRTSVAFAASATGLAACVPEEEQASTGPGGAPPAGEPSLEPPADETVDPFARPGLSQAKFAALVGTWFHLRGNELDCDAELVEVIAGPVDPGTDQFNLRFRADRPVDLGSGVYEFTHHQLQSFEAWIDPTPSEPEAPEYTGVFNLMPEDGQAS